MMEEERSGAGSVLLTKNPDPGGLKTYPEHWLKECDKKNKARITPFIMK
jgi:hypothetical protein